MASHINLIKLGLTRCEGDRVRKSHPDRLKGAGFQVTITYRGDSNRGTQEMPLNIFHWMWAAFFCFIVIAANMECSRSRRQILHLDGSCLASSAATLQHLVVVSDAVDGRHYFAMIAVDGAL